MKTQQTENTVTVRSSRNIAVTPFSQGRDHYGRGDIAWAVIKVKAVQLLERNFKGGMVKNRGFLLRRPQAERSVGNGVCVI
jgi:hypothetical protein